MNRATQLAPVIFLLTGAGAAICVGMLAHNKPPYRVHLEDSTPLALLGGFVGALVGCEVAVACHRRPRWTRGAGLTSVALLGAALMAPLGWIAGTIAARDRLPRMEVEEAVWYLPPLGMAAGAGFGSVMGLVLGVVQLRMDRRASRAEPVAAPDRCTEVVS